LARTRKLATFAAALNKLRESRARISAHALRRAGERA
jgi:hypothetical protein